MQKFDDRGKFDGAARVRKAPGRVAMAKQQQRGANTLTATAEKIAGDF